MATTADFKMGLCLDFNNDLYTIIDFQHVKPGKGPAFVRTKLKSLNTGKIIDHTFNAGVKVTTARVETRPHQYLFEEESGYVFMNNESFEQVTIPEKLVENADLMKEGQEVEIMTHAETETPLTCLLPAFVILDVTYTETGLKGDTATNTLKPATLETGANVMVPLFINEGDSVKIDTRTRAYVERVKK